MAMTLRKLNAEAFRSFKNWHSLLFRLQMWRLWVNVFRAQISGTVVQLLPPKLRKWDSLFKTRNDSNHNRTVHARWEASTFFINSHRYRKRLLCGRVEQMERALLLCWVNSLYLLACLVPKVADWVNVAVVSVLCVAPVQYNGSCK